ncbi:response regulator transcription factor [Phaeodactylibacter sp.]|jgi:DNA-binding NarL/FixJ family response regulator|uniref:response regulator transcription factor n=2 Tax=Phaeodactylibacter sp. TaxID=1940289 RepID=UPI0025CD4F41|nr:response regulator transcription factor [Phaeodactylibacter sp.]MCI4648916.1 response regulator transcription factor [Phaeodactylibacter sp.]
MVMRIALADDEALFRRGIALILEEMEDTEIVFEADNGQSMLDQLARAPVQPDVLLLDLNMPVLNGVDAAKALREQYPELRFIVLTTYFSKSFVLSMLELGAAAYLPKNATPELMQTTVREVVEKGFFYNDEVLAIIRENMVKPTRQKLSKPFQPNLTAREREVLQLICEEHTTPEIAEQLFISTRTVEGHRNNLLSKLQCRNTAGLVVVALQEGLVEIKRFRF